MLIPQELQLSRLKTWLLYWSESYKHLHCSGKFHPKKGFLQCFQDKGGSHAHIRADPGSGNHWFSPCIVYEESALYTITFCKHTDAHRSRFNLLLLKKKRTQNSAVYRQTRINPSHNWRFHWKTCQAIYVYEHGDKWRPRIGYLGLYDTHQNHRYDIRVGLIFF